MQELPSHIQMLEKMEAFRLAMCIYVAIKRGFADIIEAADNYQASIEVISQEAKIHPLWTRAVLLALTRAGIFVETEEHLFKNTPLSDCMRSDHPHTVKWRALFGLNPRSIIQWSQLDYCLDEVGTSIAQRLWGKELYELWDSQSGEQSVRLNTDQITVELEPRSHVDMFLDEIGAFIDPPIAKIYPFKGTVCDLGGGKGNLLTAIFLYHPDVKGILVERPVVIDNLMRQQTTYPFALVGGDLFQHIPHADIYIFKQIFHSLPDHLCVEALQKCAQVNPDAKVLVIEQVIGESKYFLEHFNMIMMFEQNGKERDFSEYKEIASRAEFHQVKLYPTETFLSIIELIR